ncbi:RelA/SpoT family protein [Govanella unica]|uniref:GTP pyrophosphokinase rsh n=1 Tax=Govanella unica TaxID=2975056 RepID=A0A9X3TYX6_9PROT|nr:bifunctional (p)ppGpp synthetase/guanosine-3',5'-bis(diphosphate) 3'-pyrophosphohydrolase [Govania unica]
MIRQYELVERVRAYDKDADEALLNRAYVFSMRAHGSQTRASGDPYFSHPLEVAGILTDMQLDCATIVTALLHDTIEDTIATYEEIEELFGVDVARLVDGVTKLSRIEMVSEVSRQAENFRKFLLAMSSDIRVLLVKLADRLHNMRTLHYIKTPEKRRRIALETMEIYAPLAARIGMHEIKEELEELSFQHLFPEARASIMARLDFLHGEGGEGLRQRIMNHITTLLQDFGIAAQVTGREKTPYSIWRKMQNNNVAFEQLSDIMAFRVIVDSEETCYRVLGLVHGHWQAVPGTFDDYISTPKRNGYQSLHTAVMGPERQRIEVQIRTEEMHRVAELGVAAHWSYKQNVESTVDGMQYKWIQELLEILDHASSPEEFLENTKLAMFQDQVFCFTPKGELIALPRGATPVDFAYAVHSQIGDTCVGAKVNGKPVPLRSELHNGDQVEILRSKAQTPNPRWESFVNTGKARSAIRRHIRQQQRKEYMELGREILERAFEKEDRDLTSKAIQEAVTRLKLQDTADLYMQVGQGTMSERQVFEIVFPGAKLKGDYAKPLPFARDKTRDRKAGDHAVPIKGLTPGVAVHLSECCHPLPGDRIVGVMLPGKGVMVHTIDCEALEAFMEMPERWVDLSWYKDEDQAESYVGRVEILISNEIGALAKIAEVVARDHGNINNLRITDRDPEFFRLVVDLEVHDVKHLTNIVAALRANPVVNTVERVRG